MVNIKYVTYTRPISLSLRGNWVPNQKLACFALYLKNVNTFFFQNDMYASYSKLEGTQKWHWNFSRPNSF